MIPLSLPDTAVMGHWEADLVSNTGQVWAPGSTTGPVLPSAEGGDKQSARHRPWHWTLLSPPGMCLQEL